jgi:hypothetical protein
MRTDPSSKAEIVLALKEMKNKVTGILKADLDVRAEALLPLFRDICTFETIPDDWKRGVIVNITKSLTKVGYN